MIKMQICVARLGALLYISSRIQIASLTYMLLLKLFLSVTVVYFRQISWANSSIPPDPTLRRLVSGRRVTRVFARVTAELLQDCLQPIRQGPDFVFITCCVLSVLLGNRQYFSYILNNSLACCECYLNNSKLSLWENIFSCCYRAVLQFSRFAASLKQTFRWHVPDIVFVLLTSHRSAYVWSISRGSRWVNNNVHVI
jgi:hypothetical protein